MSIKKNVARFKKVLRPYMEEAGDMRSAIRDLLTDLRHAVDALDLDYYEIDKSAYEVYLEEREEREEEKRRQPWQNLEFVTFATSGCRLKLTAAVR